eukprot:505326_1
MLCCGGNLSAEQQEDLKKSKNYDMAQAAEQHRQQHIKKLLLLGAGESGKSTLFKQMISIYGTGFTQEEFQNYEIVVYNNMVQAIKVLVQWTDELLTHPDIDGTAIIPDHEEAKTFFQELDNQAVVDAEFAKHLATLWGEDAGIAKTYSLRTKFQFPDSAKYFFDDVERIAAEDYVPNEQDVLRSRVRTTGIVELEFIIDGQEFKMFDVGGQRNERKKLIHCFGNVTAVIFVAAISEYDQKLYEDNETNRLCESLELFEEICNSRWFRETSIILFLNKSDLFLDKIMKEDLKNHFPEFEGDVRDYEQARKWLQQLFVSKNRSADKEVYSHTTCATDKKNVKMVFDAVKDIVIKASLREGGLM